MIDDQHTAPLCPNCNQPMVHTAVGDVCMECGTLIRHGQTESRQPSTPPTANHVAPSLAEDPLPPSPIRTSGSQEITSPTSHEQTAPEVTVKDAIRFRHRLKARLRRLVVPELPSMLDEPELPSSLSDPELSQPMAAKLNDTPPDRAAIGSLPVEPKLANKIADETLPTTPPGSAEIEASRHTKAYQLAEEIAENDMLPTVLTNRQLANTQNRATHSDTKVDPANEPKKSKGKQVALLAGTVLCLALVAGIGVWMLARQNANRVVPAVTKTNQPQVPGPPKASSEAISRDQKRKDDLNTISAALEVYKQQQGRYPAGDDIKVIYPLQYTTPPYITVVNYDPSSTADVKMKYAYQSNGTSFTVAAKLEDSTDPAAQNGYYIVRSK